MPLLEVPESVGYRLNAVLWARPENVVWISGGASSQNG
jgi:hypothetical protein